MPEDIQPFIHMMSLEDGRIAAMIAIVMALTILSVWFQIEFIDLLRGLPEKETVVDPIVEDEGHYRKITFYYTDRTGEVVRVPLHGPYVDAVERFTWGFVNGRITRTDRAPDTTTAAKRIIP